MVPNDSGVALGFAGPQMESRSCSGTDSVTGLGLGAGRGGGGGSGGGTGTLPYTTTVSDRGATSRRWLTTGSTSAPIANRTADDENPSS